MVIGVLILGLFNLALGFGLAVAIEHAPKVQLRWRPRWKIRWPKLPRFRSRAPAVLEESASTLSKVLAALPELPPAPPPQAELPAQWLDALEESSVVAGSFVEASVQVLRLEVGKYRERLINIDEEIRGLVLPAMSDYLQTIATHVREVNIDWLGKQADAASHLSSRRGNLGTFEAAGLELENVLLDQAAQIETTLSNLQIIDFVSDVEASRKKLTREMCRLVDLAHTLRDRMSESLLSIMIAEGKAEGIDRKFQVDGLTNLSNRFGLEVLLQDWWRDDPNRQRLASCVLVDIDKLCKLNERHGARQVDVLLGGFGRWLNDQVRQDRGFDRVVRLSGEAFVLFLGDTGPRNATSAAERIRQTLAATTFELGEQTLELAISCGVVEIDKQDNSATLLKHLHATMRHAKQAGRDRTSLDEGNGPQVVEPPQFNVKGKVVRVHE